MWVRVYLILLRDRTDVIKGVFFGVVACKLFCVLMVLLCGGVWRDVFFPMFSYGVWQDVFFLMFSYGVEVSMEIFQILLKVSVEGFGQVGLEDLLSV